MYKFFAKPVLDFVISLVMLLLLLPLFALIGFILLFLNGRPVIFKQKRPGKNGKIFTLYKFRTMSNEFSVSGEILPDIQRLTGAGSILRKFSLDELPQFLNVLRGELSIVGPRPLLIEYLGLYSPEQSRRHEVKPGITGWAQVNGRNSLTWEEKFSLDVYYVDNISFRLDMRIIWMTFVKLFRRSGIYNNQGNTMEKFTGSRL